MKIGREVKIGLFALIMLVCLYLGVNYLKGKDVFNSDRTYTALFDQTRGLQTSSPVLLRGVKVTVNLKRDIVVPDDSRLVLFSNGLMGGMAIELVRGSSANNFRHGAIIPSEVESDLLESASI